MRYFEQPEQQSIRTIKQLSGHKAIIFSPLVNAYISITDKPEKDAKYVNFTVSELELIKDAESAKKLYQFKRVFGGQIFNNFKIKEQNLNVITTTQI